MTWLKIDDKFAEHSKVERLSDKAFRLHVAALCRCAQHLTDGRVSERDLRILIVIAKATTWKKYVNELVAAGLWTPQSHGWKIHDFLEYNPSSVKVKEQRERNARNQRSHRLRHRGSHDVPSRPGYITEQPQAFVPKDVTSEVDAENVIDFGRVLKDVS